MSGFQSFDRTRRVNNLALIKDKPSFTAPAPTTVSLGGNQYRTTFTSPGSFNLSTSNTFNPSKKRQISSVGGGGFPGYIEVLVVAGGGGGSFGGGGGAGGGGGVVYDPSFTGASGEYTVVVGSGGGGELSPAPGPPYPLGATGSPGNPSEIYFTSVGPGPSTASPSGLKAIGGGGAGGGYGQKPGGSGGGTGWFPGISQGGAGIQPTITQSSGTALKYGNSGGYGTQPGYSHSGGGGGAGGGGSNGGGPAGPGGSGYTSSISGSPYPYSAGAGGGTGGRWTGPGGSWNGGYGARGSPLSGRGGGCPPGGPNANQEDGIAASGYGAGGGPGGNFIHVGPSTSGKNGYQGVVIIKYTQT